jgi:metal-responsive CopG/Arc/MetJ family transcriptional regulator
MPKMNDDNWSKKYRTLHYTRRFLVSFPGEMLEEIEILAQGQQVSQAELIRRAVSDYLLAHETNLKLLDQIDYFRITD